ncbi:MAG: hypothetical protein H6706_12555 [Myxococcales bacterium]|nr:hypothetical protein [Myxococcales bacterium]
MSPPAAGTPIGALPGRWVAAAFGGAALLGGASWWHPVFAPAAWAWAGLLTLGLLGARSPWRAFWGCWAASLAVLAIGYDWVDEMMVVSAGYSPVEAQAAAYGQFALYAGVPSACLALAAGLLRRRVPAVLWLPTAWVVGEWLRFVVVSISIDDWLATQWRVEPVLRALGRVGYLATSWLCLAACAALADALLHRRPRRAWPAVAIGVAALALPPLPPGDVAVFQGIAALHMVDDATPPDRAPPGEALELVVWPEDALYLKPYLAEGHTPGARLDPLLPESPARHVIGLLTRLPRGVLHNQAVAVEADGRVSASRAKRLLMPIIERRYLGLGRDVYQTGHAPTRLDVGGRALVALICGELLARPLVQEGVAQGGQVLVVLARDQMMVNDRALRHLLAVQVLRSVEYGVPSVRASLGGRAAFVGADGRVLAQSGRERSGFLLYDPDRGPRDVDFHGRTIGAEPPPPAPPPDVVVLYARDAPRYRARCPEGRCAHVAIEDFTCGDERAKTVIVSGHGEPPTYLSRGAEEIGAAVRCLAPELVVFDTCHGASAALFQALGDLPATVVASPGLLPPSGLVYGPGFFTEADPQRRAEAVRSVAGPLARWRVDPAGLAAALAGVEAMGPEALRSRIARRKPAQIRLELSPTATILVPVDPARLVGPRARERPAD